MDFIFITLILIILIGISFFLNTKKAVPPLIFIYIIFIFTEYIQIDEKNSIVDDNKKINDSLISVSNKTKLSEETKVNKILDNEEIIKSNNQIKNEKQKDKVDKKVIKNIEKIFNFI